MKLSTEMQPLTSVSSWPSSGVLATDTGAVAGQGLGEYKLEESYDGRPLYIQRDTVNTRTFYLFFYNDGEQQGWYVGDLLGRPWSLFYNPSNCTSVPGNGWRASNGTSFVDEASITFGEGNIEPCEEVRVS